MAIKNIPNRCSVEVRYPGTNFPHYHQCKRQAVTTKDGKPVCKQHSLEAEIERRKKREAADKRRQNLYFAYLRSKNKK